MDLGIIVSEIRQASKTNILSCQICGIENYWLDRNWLDRNCYEKVRREGENGRKSRDYSAGTLLQFWDIITCTSWYSWLIMVWTLHMDI